MGRIFSVFRTTAFLVMLFITLLTSTISLGVWAFSLTTQVATMTAGAAATAVANRKAIASAIARTQANTRVKVRTRMMAQRRKAIAAAKAKTRARTRARVKAKARLRRVMVAVPIAGLAAAAAFEHSDYMEWKEDNPLGDLNSYGCEVATISGELVDEVLQELPERVRPAPDTILNRLPTCSPMAALRGVEQ